MSDEARVRRSAPLPFVQVATAIIRDQSLSAQARHLYTVLATYADISSREAKLFRSTLAKDIGKSVDTLDRLVRELVDAGVLSVLTQAVNNRKTSSIYSLHDAGMIDSRAVQEGQNVVAAPMRLPVPDAQESDGLSGRTHAATGSGSSLDAGIEWPHPCGEGGRTDAELVAAPMRHRKRDLELENLKESKPLVDAEATTERAAKRKRRTPDEMNAGRPELAHLCNLLADLIEGNGSLRPKVNAEWLTHARLMLDADGRDPGKAEGLIRWSQQDDFWKTNIECMKTFRKKYDRLRLKANKEWRERQEAAKHHDDRAAPEHVPPPQFDPYAELLRTKGTPA